MHRKSAIKKHSHHKSVGLLVTESQVKKEDDKDLGEGYLLKYNNPYKKSYERYFQRIKKVNLSFL